MCIAMKFLKFFILSKIKIHQDTLVETLCDIRVSVEEYKNPKNPDISGVRESLFNIQNHLDDTVKELNDLEYNLFDFVIKLWIAINAFEKTPRR